VSRVIAFFDLDRTLISVNSLTGWMRREVRLGHLSKRRAAQGVAWIGAYRLGFSRMEGLIRAAVSDLAGNEEAVLQQRTASYFQAELINRVRPGAHAAIAQHRAAGHSLYLLTASSNYLADAVVDALNLDGALSNRFEVEGGRFTGKAVEPICYGPGKAELARQLADQHGVALSDCAFYTDSFSDLPALEVMGVPVAVNPDPRLLRVARKRGWRVEDWGD
jgi:HAD superfamily hydrolase (TIGR01490 family)